MKLNSITILFALLTFEIGVVGVGNQVEALGEVKRNLSLNHHLVKRYTDKEQVEKKLASYRKDKDVQPIPGIKDIMKRGQAKGGLIICKLAASYGELTEKALFTMDRAIQTVIGYTVLNLLHLPKLTWHNVLETMRANHLLKRTPHTLVEKQMHRGFISAKIVPGDKFRSYKQQVLTWYTNAIGNADVVSDVQLKINSIGRMISKGTVGVNSFTSLFHRRTTTKMVLLQVGVLRYPDIDKPHLMVYNVALAGFNHLERTLWMTKRHSVIALNYESEKFSFNEQLARRLTSKARDYAIDELKRLFKNQIKI